MYVDASRRKKKLFFYSAIQIRISKNPTIRHQMFHAPEETTRLTIENTHYRHVVELTDQYAFVLMAIPPGGKIPMEKHEETVQFTRLHQGTGSVTRNGKTELIPEEGHFFVPHGVVHEVSNDDPEGRVMKLYNVYIPPPPDFYEGLIQHVRPKSPEEKSSGLLF